MKIKPVKRNPILRTWEDGIVVDHFAGGGGASSGIEAALGRSPTLAINHDPEAIAMHKANHPATRHFIESVWKVDPIEACQGRAVSLMWLSPTCTHFSKAKGKGLDAESIKIRGLAWLAVRWAAAVKPRLIVLENVEEFAKWGPLHRQHSDHCQGVACAKGCTFGKGGRKSAKAKRHTVGCPGRLCSPGCQIHKPIKARESETFNAFIDKLGRHYAHVEWRLLRACDFGAPTTRRRLFLQASDEPIVWPEATHGPGRDQPYHTAAECIDWSLPCPSIFERPEPLKDKTLARIARGIRKFVLEAARPFVVPPAYGDKGGTDVRVNDVDAPLPTICGNRGGHAIVVPYLVHRSNGERKGQAPRIYDVNEPLRTIVGSTKHAAAVALLIKHNGGNNDAHGSSGQELTRPLDALCTKNTKAVTVAHLVRYNSENSPGSARGQQCELPLSTIDTANRVGIVTSHLMKMRGTSEAHLEASSHSMAEPVPTVTATANGGAHMYQVSAFLMRYNGKSLGQEPSGPIGTLDTTDRYALVTVKIDGEEYVIADIGMRMLTPRELFRAQGFAEDYQIAPEHEGKRLSKTAQIRMVGNSVCPPIAAAIVRAQLGRSAPQRQAKAA